MAPNSFICGYCDNRVASNVGFFRQDQKSGTVYICPHCDCPSYFIHATQVPGVAAGRKVESVPTDIASLYDEARNSVAVSAQTASVLTCRKILAHIAVDQGAPQGKSFLEYVEYLAKKGYVPPHGQGWVDHIRKKGNEANHEIVLMTRQDAEELITFTEMLLRFIYEFPNRIPPHSPTP